MPFFRTSEIIRDNRNGMVCFYGPFGEHAFVWTEESPYIDILFCTTQGDVMLEGNPYKHSDVCIRTRDMEGEPLIEWNDWGAFLKAVSDFASEYM